nr:hypothetical protein [uncultured bacterium]
MQLPEAYRSLPRPSSPLDPKASTVCPYLIFHQLDDYSMLLQYVKELCPSINWGCGEYRSRTDDLLRARQAL